MISTISKQGGRRYPQMGSTAGIFAGRLLSVGETEASIPVTQTSVISGVRKKVIRLSDMANMVDRQSTADYIKDRLKLAKAAVSDDVDLKVKPRKFKVKKGDEHERNLLEQEKSAIQARADAEQKAKIIRNNSIIAIILASET